jgi:hypothetical protein
LADFGPFSKREEKTKIRAEIDSHGTRDSDASTSPGGGAAGDPLRTPYRHAVLRIAAAFGVRTPHILRRSCAVSLQKKKLSRPLEAVMDPTCIFSKLIVEDADRDSRIWSMMNPPDHG